MEINLAEHWIDQHEQTKHCCGTIKLCSKPTSNSDHITARAKAQSEILKNREKKDEGKRSGSALRLNFHVWYNAVSCLRGDKQVGFCSGAL
jgi:hypothetical protein